MGDHPPAQALAVSGSRTTAFSRKRRTDGS
jgi:hypothetical protein